MIKIICTLFLQIICTTSKEQIIQFKAYLKNNCTKKFEELKEYQLKRNGFEYFSVNSGIIATLPDTGTYILKSHQLGIESDSILIHIQYGLNIDTIKGLDIIEVIKMDINPTSNEKEWSGWLCCGVKCEGFKVDYYNNDVKRIEGKFKNGKPVGKLKYYDELGRLKYIEYYSRYGKKINSKRIKNSIR